MNAKLLSCLALFASVSFATNAQAKIDSVKQKTLSSVEVIGTRANAKTPMSYNSVSKKEIAKSNFGQDLPFLMLLTPSFVPTSDAGTGIGYTNMRVRGTDATRINVMINGVPYNDSESQGAFLVDLPDIASSLESMQVQRGVGTSTNGASAFGASINLQSAYLSTKPYASVSLSGGSFNTFRRNISAGTGRIAGKWAVDARLSKITSDGYVDRGSVDLASYYLQAGYFGDNTSVRFMTFGGVEQTGIAWYGITKKEEDKYGRRYNPAGDMKLDKNNPRYYKNTDNYWQNHYHLIFTHIFSPELKLNAVAHYTRGYGYTDEYRTGRKLVQYGLQPIPIPGTDDKIEKISLIRRKYLDNHFYGFNSTLNYDKNNWQIIYGMSANQYKGDHYGERRWLEQYPTTIQPNDIYYQSLGQKSEFSNFLKINYRAWDALNIFADAQYRFINYQIGGTVDHFYKTKDASGNKVYMQQVMNLDKNFHFFNPKAGLLYDINKNNNVYFSVAMAHREPDRHSYTDVFEKDYPESEELIDYELGYNFKSENISLSANLFYMDYINQLVATGRYNDIGEAVMTNIKDSYRMGFELSLGIKFLKHFRYDLALALSRNKLKEYKYTYYLYDNPNNWEWAGEKEETYNNTDIAYSPSVIATNMLSFNYKGFETSIVNRFVSSQQLDNTGNADRIMPAYNVTDLRLSYNLDCIKFLKNSSIDLMINNVFNQKYHSNAYMNDIAVFQDNSPTYNEIKYFPQAGINLMLGLSLSI